MPQMIEYACNAGDLGSIPGSERSLAEGNGNPPQYSCLGNFMDRGDNPWDHIELDTTEQLTLSLHICKTELLCCTPETDTML